MTSPLVDADPAARVGQAPRFVSAVALAEATSQASLWVGGFGWSLGVAILAASGEFSRTAVLAIVGGQAVLCLVLTLLSVNMARRGATAQAAPLPAGVVLVPRAETRRAMLRAWMAGMLVAVILLAVMTAGTNQTLLGAWSAAMLSLGLGQRARARAFAAREDDQGRALYVPERRQRELPRLATGPLEPEIKRD